MTAYRAGETCDPDCSCGRHLRNKNEVLKQKGQRYCRWCDRTLPLDQFYTYKKSRTQHFTICKRCYSDRKKKEWEDELWSKRIGRLYDLTPEQYMQILSFQNDACFICQKKPAKRRLSVDHEHKSGLVRGLLCWRCNTALGRFRDSEEMLARARGYIADPPATTALGKPTYGRKGRVRRRTRKKSK